MIHTVKGFGIVNKAEVDVSLEFSCFFYNPANVGNLISGSSAFSKSSLNIWKFTVHILLKPGLENVERCFASVCDERSCAVVWMFFGIAHPQRLQVSPVPCHSLMLEWRKDPQAKMNDFCCCCCLFIFCLLAMPPGMWDLSSLTRDLTHAPCSGGTDS